MAVADIFTAVAEDRPYRKGMQRGEIEKILKNRADMDCLDKRVVNLLLENYGEVLTRVTEKQAATKEYYEHQFANTGKECSEDRAKAL
jgi:HD-GYP domain-containing protein (c-di-GMP phosphodiesterase class II)